MNKEVEKNRLLDSIEIIKLFSDDLDINLNNIGIKIASNSRFFIFSDVVMDAEEVLKYDAKKSKIIINYILYDEQDRIIDKVNYSVFFEGGFGRTDYKGNESIGDEFYDIDIKKIEKIKIEIDTDFHEKMVDGNDENSDNEPTYLKIDKSELLKNIERLPKIEEKYGITIENIGFKDESFTLTVFADVSIDYEDWKEITFTCVLYDSENCSIDQDDRWVHSNDFTGFTSMRYIFTNFEDKNYYSNVKKIRIYPSSVEMIENK